MKLSLLKVLFVIPILYYSLKSCPRRGNYFIHFDNNELQVEDIVRNGIMSVKKSFIRNGDTIFDTEDRYNTVGEHYYHSYLNNKNELIERIVKDDSIRVLVECYNKECMKKEQWTIIENDTILNEKFDENGDCLTWSKRMDWTEYDSIENRKLNYFYIEYVEKDVESSSMNRLNSIEYYDTFNQMIQEDYHSDDALSHSFFYNYIDGKLIKDSTENFWEVFFYKDDTLIQSQIYSDGILNKEKAYQKGDKTKEIKYFNDTLAVEAINISVFNTRGLDSFMLSYFMVDHYFVSHIDSSDFQFVDEVGDSIFNGHLLEFDSLVVDLQPDTVIYEYKFY
ncbi:MAG: hypothetical protein ACPG6V_10740 [Flavobacteriales bacterium]